MSRKKQKRDAVPVEILAEGSGPIGEAAVPEVSEPAPAKRRGKKASEPDDVEVVAEPAPAKRRGKKASEPEDVVAADAETAEVEATEDQPAPRRGKRGRRRAGDTNVQAEGDEDGAGTNKVEAAGDEVGDDVEADEVEAGADEVEAGADEVQAGADEIEAGADEGGEAMDEVREAGPDEVEADADAAGETMHAGCDMEATDEAGEGMHAAGDATMTDEAAMQSDASGDGEAVDGEDGEAGEGGDAAAMPGAMDAVQLRHLVEALIFATDKPITLQRLRQLTRVSDVRRLEQALSELAEDYRDRGIALHQVSGGYQFRTNTHYSTWVQQLIAGRPVRLSRAQLETLAIVAYRQPITRPEIDEIRGVDSSATLRLLLDRALIRVLGKREEVGRPMLYGTTKEFLDFFSLGDLRELPTLREYSELTAESRQVMSDRLGVPLAPEDGEPGAADANPHATNPDATNPDATNPDATSPDATSPDAMSAEDAFVSRAEAVAEDVFVHEGRTDAETASAMESALVEADATTGETSSGEMFERRAMFDGDVSTDTTGDDLASPDHDLVASLSEPHMAADAAISTEPGPDDLRTDAEGPGEAGAMSAGAESLSAEPAMSDEASVSVEPATSDEPSMSAETAMPDEASMSDESSTSMSDETSLSDESHASASTHESAMAEHEPMMGEHEPMMAEHEPVMAEREPLITTSEPGDLEGSYPAAHRHLGDLDPDRDEDEMSGDPMSDRAFDSRPVDDDHVEEPGE